MVDFTDTRESDPRESDTRVSGAGSRGRTAGRRLVRLSVLAAGIGGAGLVLATPGSALAATPATVKLTNSAASGSGTSYDGGTGNASNLRIVREGGKIAVTDVVPVTPAPAAYRSRRRGRCASRPSSAREVRQVSIRLGDLGDRVSVEGRFFGNVFGDAGNDFMYAGQKDCCGDSQLIYNGGPDFDTVSYERAVTAVSVTKDDINNDGLISSFGTTSGDNVRDDVEQVFGSAFADKLTGDEKFNSFFGLAVGDPTGDRRRFSGSAWLSVIRR
jgi:hypothetical protein